MRASLVWGGAERTKEERQTERTKKAKEALLREGERLLT